MNITLRHFLLHNTQTSELCVIHLGGWPVSTVWIDHEDLFKIHPDLADREVLKENWSTLPIVNDKGQMQKIPCHDIFV